MTPADGSAAPMVGPAARFSGELSCIRLAPPTLGRHRDEVLRERPGMDGEFIDDLRRRGIL